MNKTALVASIGACAVTFSLAACSETSSKSDNAAGSDDRSVVACNDRKVTFEQVPERVVAMDATSAAFLIELGAGDRIVGLSGTDYIKDFDGEMRTELESIKVLSDRPAPAEVVLAADPDLVVGVTDFAFGKFDGTASLKTLTDNDIEALWACEPSTSPATSLDSAEDYIDQLATAMDQKEAGTKVVEKFKSDTEPPSQSSDSDKVDTLLYTGLKKGGGAIFTRGGQSYANAILSVAGAKNIAQDMTGNMVEISPEQVLTDDPKLIVATVGMGRMGPQTEADVRSELKNHPVLSKLSAVKNDSIVVLPTRLFLAPSPLNAKAITEIDRGVAAID